MVHRRSTSEQRWLEKEKTNSRSEPKTAAGKTAIAEVQPVVDAVVVSVADRAAGALPQFQLSPPNIFDRERPAAFVTW
jgi:hypothetical protein